VVIKARLSVSKGVFMGYLSGKDQILRLRSNGLIVEDEAKAIVVLNSIGYYRFKGYLYPFRQFAPQDSNNLYAEPIRTKTFYAHSTFDKAYSLYLFDSNLRQACNRALEIFELSLRNVIVDHLGRLDPYAYLNLKTFNLTECNRRQNDKTKFEEYRLRLEEEKRKKPEEDFILHFNKEHKGEELPIWIAVQLMNFGTLVTIFSLLNTNDQKRIAIKFGIPDGRYFLNILRNLNIIRNWGSHHSRLWNRELSNRLSMPSGVIITNSILNDAHKISNMKIYKFLVFINIALGEFGNKEIFIKELRNTIDNHFPINTSLSPTKDMGFPKDWENLPYWN